MGHGVCCWGRISSLAEAYNGDCAGEGALLN
jgi:hypothetical protein